MGRWRKTCAHERRDSMLCKKHEALNEMRLAADDMIRQAVAQVRFDIAQEKLAGGAAAAAVQTCKPDNGWKCATWAAYCEGDKAWGSYSRKAIRSWMHKECAST